jgi:protein-S-isoprenylcysteine O-methyltransferase Ste14
MRTWKLSAKVVIASTLTLTQYILGFFVFKMPGLDALHWVGWAIWALSLIFAFAPIYILKKRGRVPRGKSYVHTTEFVDSSLYAICRHPQYVAGILFNIALVLLAQHWLIIGMGLISATLIYLDIREADEEGVNKFGVEYELYIQRVPRMNFILGLLQLIRMQNRKKK